MIAENSFIAIRSRFEFLEAEVPSGQCVEAAPDKVRLAAQQGKELVHFAAGSQRRTVTLVQIDHFPEIEIIQCQPCADVKGRLVYVGNEQMRFGRISDGQR